MSIVDTGRLEKPSRPEGNGAGMDNRGSTSDDTAQAPIDLRQATARGALVSVVGQAANFVLRLGSMVVIARLVTPEHFGLVGMVTALTGFVGLFRDAGLGQATVQRIAITDELASSLFWINLAFGALLAALTILAAPMLAAFYKEPRLVWITVALAAGFAFNGAAVQHRALLQRGMRFGTLAIIDIAALSISIIIGVLMALAGFGYWALVVMATVQPAGNLGGVWIASRWVPGRLHRGAGVRSMLQYGGLITLNSIVVYLAYNADKVLIGRYWGPEVLGHYGRAYQLISLPTENLNTTVNWVMFPVLARVQNSPQRLRAYFLKGYELFLSVVMPITLACALFAEDIVLVLLGPQWGETVPVFRLLAPSILAFALINPFGCLMQATGYVRRSLNLAFLIAPVTILGYMLGLPYGANGVAMSFSVSMLILVFPVAYWARRDSAITTGDLLRSAFPPFAAALAGAFVVRGISSAVHVESALLRLVAHTAVLFAVHAFVLLIPFGRRHDYEEILRALRGRSEQQSNGPQ